MVRKELIVIIIKCFPEDMNARPAPPCTLQQFNVKMIKEITLYKYNLYDHTLREWSVT